MKLSIEEDQYYTLCFNTLGDTEKVSSSDVASFLRTSRLDNNVLSKVYLYLYLYLYFLFKHILYLYLYLFDCLFV